MSKTKSAVIILAACAGFVVLGIASCAGLLFMGFRDVGQTVSPRIDAIFVAMANGSLGDMYDLDTTQEFRDAITKQQFEAMGKDITTRLGTLKSKKLLGFNIRRVNTNSYMDVNYNATFEKGDGTIAAKLKKQDDEWKLVGLRVDSPILRQDSQMVTCSSCGKPHAANAQFCPSCGAKQ